MFEQSFGCQSRIFTQHQTVALTVLPCPSAPRNSAFEIDVPGSHRWPPEQSQTFHSDEHGEKNIYDQYDQVSLTDKDAPSFTFFHPSASLIFLVYSSPASTALDVHHPSCPIFPEQRAARCCAQRCVDRPKRRPNSHQRAVAIGQSEAHHQNRQDVPPARQGDAIQSQPTGFAHLVG